MALPRKLKYLNMFNDGLSYMGIVESVTLPKLTRKLEKYRGGGMPGSVSIDLGLDDDALSLEWTLGGLPDVELWAQYASPGADSVPLRFTGSFQRDDTGAISAVEVVMRGRHKEYDGGENKQGERGNLAHAVGRAVPRNYRRTHVAYRHRADGRRGQSVAAD